MTDCHLQCIWYSALRLRLSYQDLPVAVPANMRQAVHQDNEILLSKVKDDHMESYT